MTILQLVSILVGQLAIIAKDPALGYRGAAITEALALLGTVLAKGEAARAELEALAAQIAEMVALDREPTKDEWTSLRSRSRVAHDTLNPPPPEPATTAEATK
jgi:hypothetical protein